MEQLDLQLEPIAAPVIAKQFDDPTGDSLVSLGLVENTYLLDINRSVRATCDIEFVSPWNLPSRLFQYPVEVTGLNRQGIRRVLLRHPLLLDHPFVARMIDDGVAVEIDASDPVSSNRNGIWWHAVDLCTKEHWRDLLDTRRFTTDSDIMGAVTFGLDYAAIDTAIARTILAEVNSPEPEDRSMALLSGDGMRPTAREKGGMTPGFWIIQDKGLAAWARVHAIEDGWVKHKGGHLYLTPQGIARRTAE